MLQPALIPLHHKQEKTMLNSFRNLNFHGSRFNSTPALQATQCCIIRIMSDQIRKIYYFPTFLESKSDFLICRHSYPSIDKQVGRMVQIILSETIRNLKRFKNCVLKCSLETVMKSFLSNNRNQLKHTRLKLENTLIMTFGKLFLIPTRIRNQRPPENSGFQTNSAVEYMPS